MSFSNRNCGVMMDMISSVLQDFTDYYNCTNAFDFLILSPHNPLSLSCQYFLAILASCRHNCQYLTRTYEEKILQYDASHLLDWLNHNIEGSKSIPGSLKGLFHLNKLLAHRPWAVDENVIQRAIWFDPNNPLSVGELMHAIYLLVNFHSLSGFIYGCGLEGAGVDLLTHSSLSSYPSLRCLFYQESDGDNNQEKSTQTLQVNDLHRQFLFSHSYKFEFSQFLSLRPLKHPIELNKDRNDSFIPLASCKDKTDNIKQRKRQANFPDNNESSPKGVKMYENRFPWDSCLIYRPMRVREKLSNDLPMMIEQFNWDLFGMEIAEKLFPDSSHIIDLKMKSALKAYPCSKSEMNCDSSLYSFDSSDSQDSVDATCHDDFNSDKYEKLRTVIWEYVQAQYGVIKDTHLCTSWKLRRKNSDAAWLRPSDIGCSPSRISYMLEEGFLIYPIRHYIKLVATSPETLTKSDFEKVLKYISPNILIMINIVIKEARFQCELLYALRAVHQYMQTARVPSIF